MLIYLESGRLGNQLFQYAALRTLAQPGEHVILVGFSDLRRLFSGVDAAVLTSPRIVRLCQRLRPQLESMFRFVPTLGIVIEGGESGGTPVVSRQGWAKYVVPGYFQSENSFDERCIRRLAIRRSHLSRAEAFFERCVDSSETPVFVHVRRSDYLTWPTPEAPAALPIQWYYDAMDAIRAKITRPRFIVTTDDPEYCEVNFGMPEVVISRLGPWGDFALMANCRAGVLSASSFSWWAAFFAMNKSASASPLFIGPQHWAGRPVGEWYPPHIESSFISYL